MLQWLRTNSRHAFIYLLFLILISMFVFSLAGGGKMAKLRSGNSVSMVYGRVIDVRTFSNALSDRERQYRNMLGDQWTDKMARQLRLPEQVLAQMENRMLMEHGAKELGLEVTDTELKDRVIRIPGFVVKGVFDYERYKRALAYQRQTPKQFEDALREDMLVEKMQQFLEGSAHVSRDEALAAWRSAREKVDIDFVAFDLGAYRAALTPTDAEIKAFAGRSAALVKSYYDTHAFEYKRPAQVHARHILIAVPASAPAEEQKTTRARAGAIAVQARKPGADFTRLARENSADPGSKDKGGDLGWLSPGQTVKSFDKAAFAAKPGQILGPVKSEFGWHIVLVEEKRPPLERKLDEVKPEIARRLLAEEKGKAATTKAAEALLAAAKGAKDFGALPLPPRASRGRSGPFTREAVEVPGLGASGTLVQTAFALTPEAPLAPQIVTVGDKLVVARLRSRTPAPASPSPSDLLPIREGFLTLKRQQAVQMWIRAERARAEQKKEIARNQETLKDMMGG